MGGRGATSASGNAAGGLRIVPDMENAQMRDELAAKMPQPTDQELEDIQLWSRGDYHQDMREAQAERKDFVEEVWDDFEKGQFDDGWTRERVQKWLDDNPYDGVDKSGSLARANRVEGYIERSPDFEGTLYRGIGSDSWDYAQISGKRVGDEVDFKSMTSWSTYDSDKFTYTFDYYGKPTPVPKKIKLVTDASRHRNALISPYSLNLESEVIVSSKSSAFKIVGISETDDEIRYFLR